MVRLMPKSAAKLLLIILLVVGLLWARSSYGKITAGTFISSLGTTLSKSVDKNPYPWFKEFLNTVVIPNSQIFGFLTFWGEFLTAISISVGALVLLLSSKSHKAGSLILALGLLGGAFLSIIFWLGLGFTSPSTDGLNLLMAVVEVIGLFFVLPSLMSER